MKLCLKNKKINKNTYFVETGSHYVGKEGTVYCSSVDISLNTGFVCTQYILITGMNVVCVLRDGIGHTFLDGIFMYFERSFRDGLYLGDGVRKYLASLVREERL